MFLGRSAHVATFGLEFVETTIAISLRVASTTIFVYNFLLTLGDEIDYIWKRKWAACTIVYLGTRYISALCLIYVLATAGFRRIISHANGTGDVTVVLDATLFSSPTMLFGTLKAQRQSDLPVSVATYTGGTVFFFAMVLLQVRAYALCDMRKSLLYTFSILDVLAFIIFIIEVKLIRSTDLGIPFGIFENDPQISSHATNFTPIFWAPFFLNETVTFSFVIHKAWQNRRASEIRPSSLFDTLVQHSILYYLIILVTYMVGLVFLLEIDTRVDIPIHEIAFDHLLFSIMMSGVLAPNLFLSLRKAYYDGRSNGLEASTPSAMLFNARSGIISQLLSVH